LKFIFPGIVDTLLTIVMKQSIQQWAQHRGTHLHWCYFHSNG